MNGSDGSGLFTQSMGSGHGGDWERIFGAGGVDDASEYGGFGGGGTVSIGRSAEAAAFDAKWEAIVVRETEIYLATVAQGSGSGGNQNLLSDGSGLAVAHRVGDIDYEFEKGTEVEVIADRPTPYAASRFAVADNTRVNSFMNGQSNGKMPGATNRSRNNGSIRPDADGYLTLSEANNWYNKGKGGALHVDLSKLDLSSITAEDFPNGVGSSEAINLLFRGNATDGLVYGTLLFTYHGNNKVTVAAEPYDFDMKPWNSFRNTVRNVEAIIGVLVAGKGTPYMIHFDGEGTIGRGHRVPIPPFDPTIVFPR